MASLERKIYYTLSGDTKGIHYYDQDSGVDSYYSYPDDIRNFICQEKLYVNKILITFDNNVFIVFHKKINWNKPLRGLLRLNPANMNWQWYDLSGIEDDYRLYFKVSPDTIFIIDKYSLMAFDLKSGSLRNLDSADNYWYSWGMAVDNTEQRLYYSLNNRIKCLDLQTGIITEILGIHQGLDWEYYELIGARGNKLYFHSQTKNIWEYSMDTQRMEPLYWSEHLEKWWNGFVNYFDPISFKYFVYSPQVNSIYSYDLTSVVPAPGNNSIYDNEGSLIREETVATVALPINLAAGETKTLTHDFGTMEEPGVYIIRGKVTSAPGQELAQERNLFIVLDPNGLGVMTDSGRRYYRPNEEVSFNSQIVNNTANAIDSLKLIVTRNINGNITVLKEEELALAAGEIRTFQFTAIPGETEGDYLIESKLVQAGAVMASSQSLITIVQPKVEMTLEAPEFVGSKPFSVKLKLTNNSPFTIDAVVASAEIQLSQPVRLQANQTIVITKEVSFSADTNVLVTMHGDVSSQCQRLIRFSQSADVFILLPGTVSNTTRNIPFTLFNIGRVETEIPLTLTLFHEGTQIAHEILTYTLKSGEKIDGSWPVNLTAGNYRLTYSVFNSTKEFNFTCLPDYAATMTAASELTGLDELRININAFNTGCNPILGVIKLESEFAEQSIPVEILSGAGYSNIISLTDLPVIAGTYDLKITLEAMGMVLATQTVNFTREETVPPAPEMFLTDIPVNLTGGAGQELPVTVKVRNNGDAAGDCIVELSSEAITFSDTTVINLAPGAEAEHTFKMIIPEELESGTYQGRIIINETVAHFQYQVNGYKLEAVASLDKAAYLKGETATLTIAVQNKGGQSNIPLTVRVKQGDFDETREITLGTSTTLTYQIPIDDFNEKIFYGFYHSGTGRSLLLDIQNIYEATPEFTAAPDKQRYRAGEVVNFNVQVNREGWLAVAGPNDFYRFEPVDGNRSYAIPLPGDLRTGTYSVWAAFAGETLEYKIDVIGHDIRFASGKLDKTVYQNGETFQLDTVVTSGESLNCTALIEFVKPDGSTQPIAIREVQLVAGENSLNFKGTIKSDQTGTHRIRVRFQAGDLILSQNGYSFLFGKEELLCITRSEDEYFNGTEPVSGKIHLYGEGNGSVTLYLDGQMITTLAADVNGNTVIPYQISASNLIPGHHVLSAVYQGIGGKSGTVTTEFDYGTGLPDLTVSNINVSKERTNDGAIPIAVTVHKGNVLPAKEIKVGVILGNELIGEYVIPELNGEGATDTRTVLWQAGEFNGAAELKATVNYDNRVREYDVTNNTATVKVDIPMVPQVSGLPELANDPHLPITGQTTQGVLVCLYDARGMIDFGYADASGNFNLTDHCLNQGENRLRLKARNREGRESLFSEEYTVILDAAPPQIIINNLEDNRHYNYDVLPEITIEETDPAKIEYTLNGQAWFPGTAISAEGAHQLWVMVADIAGNRTERLINFTIDKTSPEIIIAGVVDGNYYNTPQSPSVSVNDLNPVTVELTLNGEPYQGAAIEEDGDYLFEVLAYDQAGNTVTRQIGFTIDRTAPVIQISGVSDGETYQGAVTPVIEVIEVNPEEVIILLNGQPFVSGTEISTTGNYELSVTAVDKAGNQKNVTFRFNLDSQFRFDHTILCNGLQLTGNASVERIFCNREVKILGNNIRIDYLGLAAAVIPDIGNAVVKELETGLPVNAIPEPDWEGLNGATSLVAQLESGKVYSNIRYNGNLYFNGNLPKITGLFVVNGDLYINGNLDLKDLAVFCTGRISIMGNVKVNGLIYAKEIRINGNLNLTGAIVTENLIINGDVTCKSGDVQRYGQWLR